MALLTNEQIREIEEREEQKRLEMELEKRRLIEAEMKRKEDERKAKELYYKQLRVAHEPLISLIDSLNENNYLVLQYQNPNGNVATYRFKNSHESKSGDYWIGYDNEYNIYISNGMARRSVIFQNILGYEVKVEMIAEVVLIGGVPYKRMVLESDKIDMNLPDKSAMSYKGKF